MEQNKKEQKKAEQERHQQEKLLRMDRRLEKIEKTLPFLNVGTAIKVTCVGFVAGVVLRVVQMLYCFDYDTGFYTDGGTMAWCSLILAVAASLIAAVMCFCTRHYFGPYIPRKNNLLGVVALLSGAALLASAALQAMDYLRFLSTGLSAYDSADRGFIHLTFLGSCVLFGLVQIFAAIGFFRGAGGIKKVPLLYMTGVLWGVSYLILVYVFYAKSSSFIENFFAVVGGASMLLSVFYLCKLFTGIDALSAAKRTFITGVFAVVLTVTYSFSNLSLLLLGKSYSGEIPPMFQLASLSVALFLLVFLMTFRVSGRHAARPSSQTREIPRPVPAENKGGRRFRAD